MLYEEEFRGKLHTCLHCVADPGIVGELMFALPTAHSDYTAIVPVKVSSAECGSNVQTASQIMTHVGKWDTESTKNTNHIFFGELDM